MQEVKVADAGNWENNIWRWSLTWRRSLFVWEEELRLEMLAELQGVVLSSIGDKWIWSEDSGGVFSVKTCYDLLTRRVTHGSLFSEDQKFVFRGVWKSVAPLKVIAFSWQMLLDRIPTRSNLLRRGVRLNGEEAGCILCGAISENSVHLLLHCPVASAVWYKLCRWLRFYFANPPNLFISFASFLGFTCLKKRKKGLALIWHAAVWVLWKVRNDRIFNNKLISVEEVVELIKVTAWRWFLGRLTRHPCLFYEWNHEPFCCMDA
jgi:hypothetical protein